MILDEPTAVLTPQEVTEFFGILRRLRDAGNALIFISHKLYEVMEISDRVVVLRDGRAVGRAATRDTNQQELARMMVGRDVVSHWEKKAAHAGEPILQIENLRVANDKGLDAVKNLSLQVHKGEILGIAGVSGNGQRELAEAITGIPAATIPLGADMMIFFSACLVMTMAALAKAKHIASSRKTARVPVRSERMRRQ